MPEGLRVRRRPMPEGLGVRRRPMPEGLGVRRRLMPEVLGVRRRPMPESLGVRRRPMPEGLEVRRRPMPEGLGVRRRPMPDLNVPNDAFRLDVSGATQDSFQPLDGSPAGRASTLYPPAALRRFTRPPRVDGSNPCEKIQDPRSGVADSAPPHSEDLLVPHSIARCFLLGSGDCRLYAPSVHVSTRPLHASRYASL